MGCGAAQVQASDRRSRPQAPVPHLLRRALALEDVPAGKTDSRLDVGRAKHLGLDHQLPEPRREVLDELDHLTTDLLAAMLPGARRALVRRVLADRAPHL